MKPLTRLLSPILLILACINSYAESPARLKVGVLASITDEWAGIGDNIVKGANLAARELNDSGGVRGKQLDLFIEDTREANSGATAVTVYRNMRRQGIQYFIGPTGTPAGLALAPIVRKDSSVVILTPTVGVRDFSDAASNIFNTRGIDEVGSKLTAEYAVKLSWKTAGVLSSQHPWESAQGRAFKSTFEQNGGKIVFFDEPLPDSNDLRSLLVKLIESKPHVVFLSNMNRIAQASRQLRALGYHGQILSTPLDSTIIGNAGGALDEAVFSSFVAPTKLFSQRFMNSYNVKPDYGADAAYDALMALGLALRNSSSEDAASVVRELNKIRFIGAAGEFSLGKDRIAVRKLEQWKISGTEIIGLK